MNHCLPEFFRAYGRASVLHGYVMRNSVVLYYCGMVNRNILYSLFKISDWIAPLSHYIRDQPVSSIHSRSRFIDKVGLFIFPGVRESDSLPFIQWSNFQAFHTSLPFLQNLFRGASCSFRTNSTLIFRPEARTQLLCSLLFKKEPNCRCHSNDSN